MSRITLVCGLVVLGAAFAVGQADPKVAALPAPPVPKANAENSGIVALRTVIEKFAELPADPQTKLGSVLEALSQKMHEDFKIQVRFSINTTAFEKENVKEPEEIGIVNDKPLRGMRNATLERYLRAVLDRAAEKGPVSSGVTFLVRRETIEITTNRDVRTRIWGEHRGPYLPLVNATFDKKPLEDALKELADQSEHNIILDARVGDKAKTPVTARFSNLPLDSAVRFLADMADLEPILQDNAIYVTTRDSALRWESRQKKDMPDDADTSRVGRVGAGVRGIVPSPAQAAGGM